MGVSGLEGVHLQGGPAFEQAERQPTRCVGLGEREPHGRLEDEVDAIDPVDPELVLVGREDRLD